jgi:hypothetical protein
MHSLAVVARWPLTWLCSHQGSCGYGLLDKTEWPYWSVAGISVKSPFYISGPLHACGCGSVLHARTRTRPVHAALITIGHT